MKRSSSAVSAYQPPHVLSYVDFFAYRISDLPALQKTRTHTHRCHRDSPDSPGLQGCGLRRRGGSKRRNAFSRWGWWERGVRVSTHGSACMAWYCFGRARAGLSVGMWGTGRRQGSMTSVGRNPRSQRPYAPTLTDLLGGGPRQRVRLQVGRLGGWEGRRCEGSSR